MSGLKKLLIGICSCVMAGTMSLGLAACGEDKEESSNGGIVSSNIFGNSASTPITSSVDSGSTTPITSSVDSGSTTPITSSVDGSSSADGNSSAIINSSVADSSVVSGNDENSSVGGNSSSDSSIVVDSRVGVYTFSSMRFMNLTYNVGDTMGGGIVLTEDSFILILRDDGTADCGDGDWVYTTWTNTEITLQGDTYPLLFEGASLTWDMSEDLAGLETEYKIIFNKSNREIPAAFCYECESTGADVKVYADSACRLCDACYEVNSCAECDEIDFTNQKRTEYGNAVLCDNCFVERLCGVYKFSSFTDGNQTINVGDTVGQWTYTEDFYEVIVRSDGAAEFLELGEVFWEPMPWTIADGSFGWDDELIEPFKDPDLVLKVTVSGDELAYQIDNYIFNFVKSNERIPNPSCYKCAEGNEAPYHLEFLAYLCDNCYDELTNNDSSSSSDSSSNHNSSWEDSSWEESASDWWDDSSWEESASDSHNSSSDSSWEDSSYDSPNDWNEVTYEICGVYKFSRLVVEYEKVDLGVGDEFAGEILTEDFIWIVIRADGYVDVDGLLLPWDMSVSNVDEFLATTTIKTDVGEEELSVYFTASQTICFEIVEKEGPACYYLVKDEQEEIPATYCMFCEETGKVKAFYMDSYGFYFYLCEACQKELGGGSVDPEGPYTFCVGGCGEDYLMAEMLKVVSENPGYYCADCFKNWAGSKELVNCGYCGAYGTWDYIWESEAYGLICSSCYEEQENGGGEERTACTYCYDAPWELYYNGMQVCYDCYNQLTGNGEESPEQAMFGTYLLTRYEKNEESYLPTEEYYLILRSDYYAEICTLSAIGMGFCGEYNWADGDPQIHFNFYDPYTQLVAHYNGEGVFTIATKGAYDYTVVEFTYLGAEIPESRCFTCGNFNAIMHYGTPYYFCDACYENKMASCERCQMNPVEYYYHSTGALCYACYEEYCNNYDGEDVLPEECYICSYCGYEFFMDGGYIMEDGTFYCYSCYEGYINGGAYVECCVGGCGGAYNRYDMIQLEDGGWICYNCYYGGEDVAKLVCECCGALVDRLIETEYAGYLCEECYNMVSSGIGNVICVICNVNASECWSYEYGFTCYDCYNSSGEETPDTPAMDFYGTYKAVWIEDQTVENWEREAFSGLTLIIRNDGFSELVDMGVGRNYIYDTWMQIDFTKLSAMEKISADYWDGSMELWIDGDHGRIAYGFEKMSAEYTAPTCNDCGAFENVYCRLDYDYEVPQYYCDECYAASIKRCWTCGSEDIYDWYANTGAVCYDCYNALWDQGDGTEYYWCHNCGGDFSVDSGCFTEDGTFYCNTCYEGYINGGGYEEILPETPADSDMQTCVSCGYTDRTSSMYECENGWMCHACTYPNEVAGILCENCGNYYQDFEYGCPNCDIFWDEFVCE